ncbi:MAG: hypothetical protein IT472_08815 [Thermomonas sp.]|uniref:hypothetical protein n=1 Tax=Thermomonas sp. TaxID=1971895 RepID=UPI00261CCBCE|nr:hypothetical protein [Thermomonas sp.]MCC7097266.1 hypothetical protein [Thermomonas sp.]
MTLRVGLTIGGDSAQAQQALRDISGALSILQQYSDGATRSTRAAAAAQDEHAAAMRRASGNLADLRAQFNPTFAVIRNYRSTLEAVRAAHTAGAISAREMADAISRERREALSSIAALKGRTTELHRMTSASNGARIGFQQLGFQAGDFFTQLSMGSNPFVAFTVQAQQAVGVIQMMHSTGGLATGTLSRMATVLSGPVGIGLGVVLPLVGILATKLFETSSAADEARASSIDFSSSLVAQTGVVGDLTAGIDQLNSATRNLISTQALLIENSRAAAQATVSTLEGQLGGIDRELARLRPRQLGPVADFFIGGFTTNGRDRARIRVLEEQRQTLLGQIADARGSVADAQTAYEARTARERADPEAGTRAQIERERARLLERRRYTIEQGGRTPIGGNYALDLIDERDFASRMQQLERRERALSERPRRDRSAAAAAARAERLNAGDLRFAEQIDNRIAEINNRWTVQPTLIRQANGAVDDLNRIIEAAQTRLRRGGIGEREAAALREQMSAAQGAIQTVADGLNQPFRDLMEQHDRQIDQLSLIRAGRDDEAAALAIIYQQQDKVGTVTREQREAILANVVAERQLNEEIARRGEIVGTYQRSIADVRSDLEGLLSGQGNGNFLGNLRRNFQQVQGRILTEQIFGPALRGLERYVREETGIESAVDIMTAGTTRAGNAADTLATTFLRVSDRIDRATSSPVVGGINNDDPLGAIAASVAAAATATTAATGAIADATAGAEERDIVVRGSVMALRPDAFFNRLVKDTVDPALAALDDLLGVRFFTGLSGVLSGAIQGYVTAGPVGAVLGAVNGIRGLPDGIQKGLQRGLAGAQTGTQIAGLGKSLGLKTSSTGGAIGGAIGGATGIPGMDIVGSIVGSLVGGLFKKTPYGTAVVSGAGDASVAGNKKSARAAAGSLAEAVQNGIAGIAEQLGGEVGSYLVSIGTYKDKVRVSGSGKTGKLKGGDVVDFGKDGQEAGVAYAIQNAIADGGIKGLSAAVQRALGSTSNLDKAVKEALKVQEVEVALGGIGAIMEREFRTFEAQARERVRVARDYGFDLVAIEKYNAEQRQALTEKLLDAQVGSLKRLVDEMTSGSLFEGSALDRRTALLAQIDSARGDLAAGKEGAGDRLASLFEQLNSLSKEIYGTTGGFAADRASILDQATAAIAKANERIAAASAASDPALATTNAALDENNDQNAQMIAQLGQLGEQMDLLVSLNAGFGSRLIQERLSGLATTSV